MPARWPSSSGPGSITTLTGSSPTTQVLVPGPVNGPGLGARTRWTVAIAGQGTRDGHLNRGATRDRLVGVAIDGWGQLKRTQGGGRGMNLSRDPALEARHVWRRAKFCLLAAAASGLVAWAHTLVRAPGGAAL